jgi:hypothetical protein
MYPFSDDTKQIMYISLPFSRARAGQKFQFGPQLSQKGPKTKATKLCLSTTIAFAFITLAKSLKVTNKERTETGRRSLVFVLSCQARVERISLSLVRVKRPNQDLNYARIIIIFYFTYNKYAQVHIHTLSTTTSMPVYLCQPGAEAQEPWRHGIQVYASPFSMDEEGRAPAATVEEGGYVTPGTATAVVNNNNTTVTATTGDSSWNQETAGDNPSRRDSATTTVTTSSSGGLPIRRVRHAEVVLVDDVCIAYGRSWLRLRWPGTRGGFAGYIALGKVGEKSTAHDALAALTAGGK